MRFCSALAALALVGVVAPLSAVEVSESAGPHSIAIAGRGETCAIAVDPHDYAVVSLAAHLFADDVQRVSGQRPVVTDHADRPQMIIVGTLGHSALIQLMAAAGKLPHLGLARGHWETTLIQMVEHPLPGVTRALVIVGSDRRGAAYGLMQLSEKIGVSPWNWWADVPAQHHTTLAADCPNLDVSAPAVKYRGIFINDEDWGMNPWASHTFDPAFGNIGPKTYRKVFELLLRLRLNYIWPAMHPCSAEFGSVPANARLADQYAIVAGSSHCEPMLYNNVHWNEKERGKWNYLTNRDAVHAAWEKDAIDRGSEEAVWTLGIRGIHDAAMETPPRALPEKLALLNRVIRDQRELLDQHVAHEWGPVAQCFVPYKEVLPIYDAGLSVPDDVTLVWVDDNFGYIRRFSGPAERKRSGGSGVYWHFSYYGGPHSYTWINTTSPALTWEELHKAWENNARTLWVVNVGDLKPAEIGIDYYSRLAWNPEGFPLGAQRGFLGDFTARNFGPVHADRLADFLMEFYRLGTIHKPELMDREWAMSLRADEAAQLTHNYSDLLRREHELAVAIPTAERDAYTEMIGFPARVLGDTGLIFMADRRIQEGQKAGVNQGIIAQLKADLEAQVVNYNTRVAGGKWNRMMPGMDTNPDLPKWSSQVRWPWGEKPGQAGESKPGFRDENAPPASQSWRAAASADQNTAAGSARWTAIDGLGATGRALALEPAGLSSSWALGDSSAPTLQFNFNGTGSPADAFIDFLPTFRIFPGMKLRVAVSVDGQPWKPVEVPGSSGQENEKGPIRQYAVQDNYVQARVPLGSLPAGHHTLSIHAIDPGAVIDRISLP